MSVLPLRIRLADQSTITSLQFYRSSTVGDVCQIVAERIGLALDKAKNYGLFFPEAEPCVGIWLNNGRSLESYHLADGELLEFKKKVRHLKVQTLDGAVKTLLVNDNYTVEQLTTAICARIGVLNSEEFSLLVDESDVDSQTSAKKKPASVVRDKKKLEALKRKLRTADNVYWLKHDRTLRDQGVQESTVVSLRKKFFFSDPNVSIEDHHDLSLLYVQCHDDIVTGAHPCTLDQAIQFAALQCQILLGNYDPKKHRPPYIKEDLDDYLPSQYATVKQIESAIFKAHAKFKGVTDINAKYRYVKECQSLKTYGVTFFLVKERMRTRNRLIPRLIGISRYGVLRLNQHTKEIVTVWPLSHVQKWGSSSQVFTVDFGDYAESYYAVQTTEGEALSDLLSGYVDIIIRKKRRSDRDVPEIMDVTSLTETISPTPSIPELSPGQQALLAAIVEALKPVEEVLQSERKPMSPLTPDQWNLQGVDFSKQNVAAHVANICASSAKIILKTVDPGDVDFVALCNPVMQLASSLREVARGVRMIASLNTGAVGDSRLLAAAHKLAAAIRDLLMSIKPDDTWDRKEQLSSSTDVGTSAGDALVLMGDCGTLQNVQEELMAKVKSIATAMSRLVQHARVVAQNCVNGTLQSAAAAAAKASSATATQLICCAKTVRSCLEHIPCREQLAIAAGQVKASLEHAVIAARAASRVEPSKLLAAAAAVSQAVQRFLAFLRDVETGQLAGVYDDEVNFILSHIEKLLASTGDPTQLLRQAQIIAGAASTIIGGMNESALKMEEDDPRARLMAAAKRLADATEDLVEAAKATARNPRNANNRRQLQRAADDFLEAANLATQGSIRKMLIVELAAAATEMVQTGGQCIADAQVVTPLNADKRGQQRLLHSCKEFVDRIGKLVQAIRVTKANPGSAAAQIGLVNITKEMVPSADHAIAAANKAVSTIQNSSLSFQLSTSAEETSVALTKLKAVLDRFPEMDDLERALREMEESLASLERAHLVPTSQLWYLEALTSLKESAEPLRMAVSELVVSSEESYARLAVCCRSLASELKYVLEQGITLASVAVDKRSKTEIVARLQSVATKCIRFVKSSREVSTDSNEFELESLHGSNARRVNDAVDELIGVCVALTPRDHVKSKFAVEMPKPKPKPKPEFVPDDFSEDELREVSDRLLSAFNVYHEDSPFQTLELFSTALDVFVAVNDVVHVRTVNAAHQECDMAIRKIKAARQIIDTPNRSVSQAQYHQCLQTVKEQSEILQEAVGDIAIHSVEKSTGSFTVAVMTSARAVHRIVEHAAQAACLVVAAMPAGFGKRGARAQNPLQQGREAQQPLLVPARQLLSSSSSLIATVISLLSNSQDSRTLLLLNKHSIALFEATTSIGQAIEANSPGKRECNQAITIVKETVTKIERTHLSAANRQLPVCDSGTFPDLYGKVEDNVRAVSDGIDALIVTARSPVQAGRCASALASYFPPLVESSIAATSKVPNVDQQLAVLQRTKGLAESIVHLIVETRESCGSDYEIITASDAARAEAEGLLSALDNARLTAETVQNLTDSIEQAADKIDDPRYGDVERTFMECQEGMLRTVQVVAHKAQEIVTKSGTNPRDCEFLCVDVTEAYTQLADLCRMAQATADHSDDDDVAIHLKGAVQDLGNSLVRLVRATNDVQLHPSSSSAKQSLVHEAQLVSNRVALVLYPLQTGSRAIQACADTVFAVEGITGDLDTTIMFATSGTLEADVDDDSSFYEHREATLRASKSLIEQTKKFVVAVTASPDQLTDCAQSSAELMTILAAHVKKGAAALSGFNRDGQLRLLNAVKDVASSLGVLVTAAKNATGHSIDDPATDSLRSCAKAMVTNVSALLQTLKSVGEVGDGARGARILESTIDAINQHFVILDDSRPPTRDATPEDLVRAARDVALAVTKAVAAGNSSHLEDVTLAAELGKTAISELLITCKAAAAHAQSAEARLGCLSSGKECALAFKALLELVHTILLKPSRENRLKLTPYSQDVATCSSAVVQFASQIKDLSASCSPILTVDTEEELLNVRSSVDSTVEALSDLRAQINGERESDDPQRLDDHLLRTARALGASVSTLINTATAVHQELVVEGKIQTEAGSPDSQWAEGMISAARMVAITSQLLCSSATEVMNGIATQDKLVAAAKAVASSAVQLLIAYQAKADLSSPTFQRLQAAEQAVTKSSDSLVNTSSSTKVARPELPAVNDGTTEGSMVREITLELELQEVAQDERRDVTDAEERTSLVRGSRQEHFSTSS